MDSVKKADAVIKVLQAVGDAIKEAGSIPSGHLFSMLMGFGCSFQVYENIIDMFIKAGKVKKENHLLIWIP